MKFRKHFESAISHLTSMGAEYDMYQGEAVSETTIANLEAKLGWSLPTELREFYLEMGDGFSICPHGDEGGFFVEPMCELEAKNSWEDQVEGCFTMVDDSPDAASKAEEEFQRRLNWFPFHGFGSGGYFFCIDTNEPRGPIRYYERVYWPTDSPEQWSFSLADSLEDLVTQWSRYCFAGPTDSGGMINHVMGLEGRFDWQTTPFPDIYKRNPKA